MSSYLPNQGMSKSSDYQRPHHTPYVVPFLSSSLLLAPAGQRGCGCAVGAPGWSAQCFRGTAVSTATRYQCGRWAVWLRSGMPGMWTAAATQQLSKLRSVTTAWGLPVLSYNGDSKNIYF